MSLTRKQTSTSSSSLKRLTQTLPSSNNSKILPQSKTFKTKPCWDSTNTDLNKMKASQEELNKRQQVHKSKNIDLVKYEKQQQLMLKQSKNPNSRAQLALLKEILHDDEQLKNLINKSDSTLKTVQDFFSLEPVEMNHLNKKQAKINMTLAPNVTDLNESNLPFNQSITKKKQSKTITTNAQVNTLNDDISSGSESESEILDIKLKQTKKAGDTEKYKHFLQLKLDLITKKLNDPNLLKPPQQQQQEVTAQNQSIINQVNDDLKRCLDDLEKKITEFDKQYDKYTASKPQATCTQTLIKIIACLFEYIKDLKSDLNYEKLVVQETNKQLDIHRKLIDGLTNEILLVKEQNDKMIREHSNLEVKFNSELNQIKDLIQNQLILRETHQDLNPPNIIDLKPSRPSAFKSHEQHRPMSSISYQSSDSSSKDKFTERINAMLQHDVDIDKLKQRPYTSTSNLDISNFLNSNNKVMSDFSVQFQELTNKNQQAQQKLKQLQSEYTPRDLALEKLKKEQEIIKEQIDMLNKQRESAQIELEVMSLTSSSSKTNLNSKKHSPSLSPISLNKNIYPDMKI